MTSLHWVFFFFFLGVLYGGRGGGGDILNFKGGRCPPSLRPYMHACTVVAEFHLIFGAHIV